MRVAGLLLGILVAGGAGMALRTDRTALTPQEALRLDSANPYRWVELGETLAGTKDIANARYCFRRALELSQDVPEIWKRDAEFHFQLEEAEGALVSSARVLKTIRDYDADVFGSFDRFGVTPAMTLVAIGNDRRTVRAYAEHLIGRRDMDGAAQVWRHASAKRFNDDRLTASYIDALVAGGRFAQAQQDWAEYLGTERGAYPDRNLLFNGGFEREPAAAVFDWKVQRSDAFDTVRDDSVFHEGKWSLRVSFHGEANVAYRNVVQVARVTAGQHTLRAWVRTEGITTNEGPRLEVFDSEEPERLDVRTESFVGSADWRMVSLGFQVPAATNLIGVQIVRDPSRKYDSKIKGDFWIDSVQVGPG